MKRHQVVIVGGGAAGISVAARLCRAMKNPDVAIVEPSSDHYYQPMWTLVGGGAASRESTRRAESTVIPPRATWIQDRVEEIDADANRLVLGSGDELGYDFLVVAAGIQIDWAAIPGLADNLGRNGVCSNYSYDAVPYTWKCIQELKSGRALFTHPNTPIKCGGAPQKIMYLAADHWSRTGVRGAIDITFGIATPKIFSTDYYGGELVKVADRYGIDVRYQRNLVEIRTAAKEAVFENLATSETEVLPYDLIHVTPPMSAPDFVKRSPVAAETGWVDVDKHTLRSTKFDNVFALGDASNLPTSKTAAAIRKQAPVCAANLLAAIAKREASSHYDGYTSCPLVTGYGKLILAEFDYDGQPQETFPVDQRKERWSMYQLKKRLLPKLYWDGMLKGRA